MGLRKLQRTTEFRTRRPKTSIKRRRQRGKGIASTRAMADSTIGHEGGGWYSRRSKGMSPGRSDLGKRKTKVGGGGLCFSKGLREEGCLWEIIVCQKEGRKCSHVSSSGGRLDPAWGGEKKGEAA